MIQVQDGTLKTIKGELIDICFKGCGVYSDDLLEAKSLIRVMITGEHFPKALTATGTVIYANKIPKGDKQVVRIGIQFTSVDDDLLRDTLIRFHETLTKKSF
jgi:hypothetical protein